MCRWLPPWPNNDPNNNNNNVDPRRRDVPSPALRLLIGTHRLSVSLSLPLSLNHSRDGKIVAVDEEASELGGDAGISPIVRR